MIFTLHNFEDQLRRVIFSKHIRIVVFQVCDFGKIHHITGYPACFQSSIEKSKKAESSNIPKEKPTEELKKEEKPKKEQNEDKGGK